MVNDELIAVVALAARPFEPSEAHITDALMKVQQMARGPVIPLVVSARRRRPVGWILAAALAALGAVGFVAMLTSRSPIPAPKLAGGTRVLAAGIAPDGRSVFVLGQGGEQLVAELPPSARNASVSSDGRTVAFAAPSASGADQDIFLIRTGGGDPTPIVEGPTFDVSPVISPDGSRIAFDRLVGAETNAQGGMSCAPCTQAIYVVNADGSGLRDLTPGLAGVSASGLAWSHDGTRIAFTSNVAGTDELHVVDVDGPVGNATKLELPACQGQGWCAVPAWSPDDAQLAFLLGSPQGHDMSSQIATIGADGSDLEVLTSGTTFFASVDWSPDGSTLAATGDEPGDPYDVYTIDAAGGAPVRLTDQPGHDGGAHWMSDGRILFVSDRTGERQLFVMDADGSNQRPAARLGSAVR